MLRWKSLGFEKTPSRFAWGALVFVAFAVLAGYNLLPPAKGQSHHLPFHHTGSVSPAVSVVDGAGKYVGVVVDAVPSTIVAIPVQGHWFLVEVTRAGFTPGDLRFETTDCTGQAYFSNGGQVQQGTTPFRATVVGSPGRTLYAETGEVRGVTIRSRSNFFLGCTLTNVPGVWRLAAPVLSLDVFTPPFQVAGGPLN